jgi:hypothetical protein
MPFARHVCVVPLPSKEPIDVAAEWESATCNLNLIVVVLVSLCAHTHGVLFKLTSGVAVQE